MTAILADVYVSPVDQFLGMLVLSHFVFPFVFMEAVTLAYIEQLFYRDVIPNRSARVAVTIRANGIAAVVCSTLIVCGEEVLGHLLRIISRWTPRSFEIGFLILYCAAMFAVPVLIETIYWNRRSGRALFRRALTANLTAGVCGIATVVFVRWLREHLPHWLDWKLRRFHGDFFWYMNPIGWSCLAILVFAWIWRLPSKSGQIVARPDVVESVNQAVEDTK